MGQDLANYENICFYIKFKNKDYSLAFRMTSF